MSKGLEATKRLKWGYAITHEERINLCECIEKELKEREKYKYFIQEICRYVGLDNLFPYDNLEEIEKEIKTMADNAHWYIANKNQKELELIKKCFYVAKSSGAILLTDYGFEHKEELKEVLL